MTRYIIYYRQWLRKSRTAVGLEEQQSEVKRFVAFNAGRIVREYTEREDPPRLKRPIKRPKLREAIDDAVRSGTVLVIPHLGRLVKNLHVMRDLHTSKVDFRCLDNQGVNPDSINLFATAAEDESARVSDRSKVAMQACVARGVKLGSARPDHWKGREHLRGTKLAIAAAAKKKRERTKITYAYLMPEIKLRRERGDTLPEIVEWLNGQGKTTTAGKPFTQTAVWRLIHRYLGNEYLGSSRKKTTGNKVGINGAG